VVLYVFISVAAMRKRGKEKKKDRGIKLIIIGTTSSFDWALTGLGFNFVWTSNWCSRSAKHVIFLLLIINFIVCDYNYDFLIFYFAYFFFSGLANRVVPNGLAREEAEKLALMISEFPQVFVSSSHTLTLSLTRHPPSASHPRPSPIHSSALTQNIHYSTPHNTDRLLDLHERRQDVSISFSRVFFLIFIFLIFFLIN
jgi:hypothetical protein